MISFVKYSKLLLALVVAPMLLACSNEKYNDGAPTIYNIVEFTSQSARGSVFTYYPDDGSEPLVLTTDLPVIDLGAVKIGNSIFMAYKTADGLPNTAGKIDYVASALINNIDLAEGDANDLDGWDKSPVYVEALWPAGDKLNLRCLLDFDREPRSFSLIVDKSTKNQPIPVAYLYHQRKSDADNFRRQYYVAFNLSSLWKRPNCRGLEIRVNNSNLTSANTFIITNPHNLVE